MTQANLCVFHKLVSSPSAAPYFLIRCGSQSHISKFWSSMCLYYSKDGHPPASVECLLLTRFSWIMLSYPAKFPPVQHAVPSSHPAHLQERQQQQPGAASYVHVWVATGQSLEPGSLSRSQTPAFQPVTSLLVTLSSP